MNQQQTVLLRVQCYISMFDNVSVSSTVISQTAFRKAVSVRLPKYEEVSVSQSKC